MFKLIKKRSEETFDVAGTFYRIPAINMLGAINRKFYLDDDTLMQKYPNSTMYQYFFERMEALIVPEPTNPVDKKALRVEINGRHVGYISRDDQDRAKSCMKHKMHYIASIRGGNYKSIHGGYIIYGNFDYTITLTAK